MVLTRRAFLIWPCAFWTLLPAIIRGQNAGLSAGRPLQIGDLVGAEYVVRSRRLFLHASEPRAGETLLFPDDVVTMARLAPYGDFSFSLDPDPNWKQLEIHYFSNLRPELADLRRQVEEGLRRVLRGGLVERDVWLADKYLKDLAYARNLPKELVLGPSAVRLCAREIQDWTRSGRSLESYPQIEYVLYYTLETGDRYDGFAEGSIGVRFTNPRVVVRASSRKEGYPPPPCIRDFASNLTKNLDQVFSSSLGATFFRLRLILLLHKVFSGWVEPILIPLNHAALAAYRITPAQTEPVPISAFPIIVRDPEAEDRVWRVPISGGIRFSADRRFREPIQRATFEPRAAILRDQRHALQAARRIPPFVISRGTLAGRTTLKIDVSAIVFGTGG